MVRTFVVLAVTVISSGVNAAPAAACSVASGDVPSEADDFRSADRAIHGKVVDVDEGSPSGSGGQVRGQYEARIRVRRVYKGRVTRFVRIASSVDGGTCGLGPLRAGQLISLYLFGRGPLYDVTLFDRTTRTALNRQTGGRWKRPT